MPETGGLPPGEVLVEAISVPAAGLLPRLRHRLRRDPRIARMVHGGLSGLLGRGLGLAVSLVSLPLTVRYLGKIEYGVWVTISTSVVMLSVFDLGIGNSLTNSISEAYASDDKVKAQRYYATAFWLTIGIVLLLLPACWFGWHAIPWGALLHLGNPALLRQAKICISISAAFFLVSMPLNLANRVLGGYQQVHLCNYFAMAANVLSLTALLLVVAFRGSIVDLMAAYCLSALAGGLALNLWLCFRLKPWMRPVPRQVHPELARLLVNRGFLFFILQLTGLVVFYSDNLVITHYLGPAAVTPYSLAFRITGYAALLQTLLVPSIWPALAEAYQKGDLGWVRRTYQTITRQGLSAIGIAAIAIALTGRPLIGILAGSSTVPGYRLLWLMAAFTFVMAVTNNQVLLLNASSRLKLEATVAVLAAAVNLLLSIYLVQRIGVEGVILASLLSFLIFMVIPQAWEVRRVLAGRYLRKPANAEAIPEP